MSALPTTVLPAQVSVSSWSPTLVSRAYSGKTQRRQRGGHIQRWRLSVRYAPLQRDEFMELWAFLAALRGQYSTFTLTIPTSIVPRGTWGGSPAVNGAVAAGQNTVRIDGLTALVAGAVKAGDFVKFSGHSKVYQVTADGTPDSGGELDLCIMPGLVTALSDNETVSFTSVPFTCILAADTQALDLAPGPEGTIAFDAIEDY